MSKKLINVTETYRLDDENEVEQFLKELKSDPNFELSKYSSVKKQKKKRGEILDEWIRFSATKVFGEESEEVNE